jgi:geranylgeranyl diphosphate synthase type I
MSESLSIVQSVDRALYALLSDERHRWQAVSTHLSIVFDELETMVLAGGKRLRPQFLHWGWVAAGGDPSDAQHHNYGAAIEFLHACALFHDDVIDDSSLRRGHLTTQRRLAELHLEDGLQGESRRFGEGSAILIGDVAFSLAHQLIIELPAPARHYWNELCLEMNMGQYLDTVGSAHREYSVSHALSVARFKTAKYTIERPLHMGAVAADEGRGANLLSALSSYGLPLGIAFQLRDDMLGAFGDESITGKPVGGDFREGKTTALLGYAMSVATTAQMNVLEKVGSSDLVEDDVKDIQQVLVDTGAVLHVENLINQQHKDAVESLQDVNMDSSARDALIELALHVTQRTV